MKNPFVRLTCASCACVAGAFVTSTGYAQLDPEPRDLLQLGFNQSRRLTTVAAFGYGINAIRSNGRGGYSASLMLQYNFGPKTSFASDQAFENLQKAQLPFRFLQ